MFTFVHASVNAVENSGIEPVGIFPHTLIYFPMNFTELKTVKGRF